MDHQEKALIEGCRKNDRAAQKELYRLYSGRMMVLCLRYAKTTLEAEDIMQEGFIKVFQHIKNFRAEAKLSTWITRIMVNTALNQQRKKLYMLPMVDVEEAGLHEAEDISLSDFHLSELLKMIQSLPDGCQVIFNLYAIEGYTHKEIAGMLGINEGTSKSQFARARQLLMERITKEQPAFYERGK